MGFQICCVNNGFDTVEHGKERFVGIPEGGLGLQPIGDIASQHQDGRLFL